MDVIIPIIIVFLVLFLSLHFAVSYDLAKQTPVLKPIQTEKGIGNIEVFNIKVFFDDLVKRLQEKPKEIKYTKSTLKFLGIGILVCFIIWGYYITTKKKYIDGKEYGTAEWGTAKSISRFFACNIAKAEIINIINKRDLSDEEKEIEIQAVKNKYEDADMLFTATERICIYNYELNNNTLIIGGSGSGKTRGYVMPNILQAHSSFVITDPKGEILEKSGKFLENKKGFKIRVLNLDEKILSNGYNPFHYIHRDRAGWEERVLTLIETIIINTDGGEKKNGSDPFWDKAERLFLQSVFFAVVEAFPHGETNMNSALILIRWLKIKEDNDKYDSDLDIFFLCFERKYGSDHIAVQQFREFREKASGKTAKSIVISAVARLAPFKVKEVRRIFSYDNMFLDKVGEEKTALFVIVPPTDKTYNFIAGMLFTQLFQELNYCALNLHKHDGQRLPVPCRFILDEFANTCKVPNFVSILAYARSLGIGITIILQSLEQIKNMYKDEWGVIIDNCNTLLYLGKVTHMDTLEYLSKLLGKGTFDKKSSSRTRGRQSSTTINNDRFGRDLLDPSEIRKIKNNKCLFFIGGQNPFYSSKFEYKRHKNYKYTSDGNKEFSYVYASLLPVKISAHQNENKEKSKTEKDTSKEAPNVTFKAIQVEYGQEVVTGFLTGQVLNSDFDPDELLVVEDGEREELSLFAELDKEERNIKNNLNSILYSVIELKTYSKSIVEGGVLLLKAEAEVPGSIDFDDIEVEDGEPSEADEYVLVDEYMDLDIVVKEAGSIIEDMTEEMGGFLEQLNSLDTSLLESGKEESP